jgi:hypothetical protein
MNMYSRFTLYFAFVVGMMISCTCEKTSLVLIENGIPKAAIVISQTANDKVKFAAEELQTYLEKVTGVELPITIDTVTINQVVISVGRTKFSESVSMDTDKLGAEGFIIQTNERSIALVGKDDQGTQFAVYDFLEKFLGIRWYWPGELGEFVPEKKTITLGKIYIREEPDFLWRHRMPIPQGDFTIDKGFLEKVALWEKRNKWGGSMPITGYHEWGNMVPPSKYAIAHPEYYGLVDGERECDPATFNGTHRCQLCTSNPEVLIIAADYVINYFDKHPETTVLNISPNDGGGFCECEQCRNLDSGRLRSDKPDIPIEEMKNQPEKYSVLTDRIFSFANRIAEKLQQKHPGKFVTNYAYSRFRDPPHAIQINPFVFPLHTSWSAYLHANKELKTKNEKCIKDWAKVSNHVAIYEYIDNVGWPGFPRLVVPQFAAFIKFLYKHNIRLFQTQSGNGFAIGGMNYYVVGKLLWDTKQDENKILDEFYQNMFKEAAPAIKKFHKRQISAWAESTAEKGEINCNNFRSSRILEYLTPEFLAACRSDLDEAAMLARDKMAKKRVDMIHKGFLYTELSTEAIRKAKELEQRGVSMFPQIKDPVRLYHKVDMAKQKRVLSEKQKIWKECLDKLDPDLARNLVEEALAAWEKRDLFVEDLKNDFIVPYLRIQRNNFGREFNPRMNLRYLYQITQDSMPESSLNYGQSIRYW